MVGPSFTKFDVWVEPMQRAHARVGVPQCFVSRKRLDGLRRNLVCR